jgi:uncharacterized protein
MAFLLDANVLIALIDPSHVHHDAAHDWFSAVGSHSWATCPMTQNAVLRIIGHLRYPNSPGTPAAVAPLMAGLCALPGHVFWPDDVSLLDAKTLDVSRLLQSGQVTDSYLLALARTHGGRLASFDRRIMTAAVPDGAAVLHLIPSA